MAAINAGASEVSQQRSISRGVRMRYGGVNRLCATIETPAAPMCGASSLRLRDQSHRIAGRKVHRAVDGCGGVGSGTGRVGDEVIVNGRIT